MPTAHPGRNTDDIKQLMIRATPEIIAMYDKAAKERGHTRNSMFVFLARALDAGNLMIADSFFMEKWEERKENQMLRTVRVVTRQECGLYMYENGYTTTPFQS